MVAPLKRGTAEDLDHPELEEQYQERSEEKHAELEDEKSDEEKNTQYEYSQILFDSKNKPKISNEHQTNFTFWIKQMDQISGCWDELGKQMMDVYTNPTAALAMNSTLQKLWDNMAHGFEDPYNPQSNTFGKAIGFQIDSIDDRCFELAEAIKKDQTIDRLKYRKLITDMRFTRGELYRGLAALGVLMRFNKRPTYKKLLEEYDDEPSEAIEGND